MFKANLRKTMLDKRKALSEKDCIKLDDLLLIQFQKFNWNEIACIGSFYPMAQTNEPNTILFTRYLKAIIPNMVIAYPKINEIEVSMEFYEETESLIENKWGILEPIPLIKVLPEQMDAILVPMLGFDSIGNRVGYGKGFYDKYFDKYAYSSYKIGLSFFDPIPKIEDTEHFDVPLSHCITPWNCYEF